MENYLADLEKLSQFLPLAEYKALRYYIAPGREDREQIGGLISRWVARIEAMPKTYEQDGKGDAAMVHLHYFYSGSDWYITEKDKEGPGTEQAFGFAILNGDTDMAELGYISIEELKEIGAELDLYFEPLTLAQVKANRGIYERLS